MNKNFYILSFIFTIIMSLNTFADVIYGPGTNEAEKMKPDPNATYYDAPQVSTTIDAATAELISQIVITDPTISRIEQYGPAASSSSNNVATAVTTPSANQLSVSETNNVPTVTPPELVMTNDLTLQNLSVKVTTKTMSSDTSAPTYALINSTKRQIYGTKDQNTKYNPSGLTNIMTAYIATQYLSLDSTLTVNASALRGLDKDASIAALKKGDKITLKDALASMFVKGCVDSANVVAENVSGNINSFVELMNNTCQSLGLTNTHFVDPSGISNNNETTALEMAVIMGKVCENQQLVELLSLYQYTLPATSSREKLILYGRNTQLNKDSSSYNADITASRLAYTSSSKFCIASMMNYNNNHIISVVLKAEGSQFNDTKKTFEFGKLVAAED